MGTMLFSLRPAHGRQPGSEGRKMTMSPCPLGTLAQSSVSTAGQAGVHQLARWGPKKSRATGAKVGGTQLPLPAPRMPHAPSLLQMESWPSFFPRTLNFWAQPPAPVQSAVSSLNCGLRATQPLLAPSLKENKNSRNFRSRAYARGAEPPPTLGLGWSPGEKFWLCECPELLGTRAVTSWSSQDHLPSMEALRKEN